MTAPFSAWKSLTKAYAPTSPNVCLEKFNYKLCGHQFTSLFGKYVANYKNDI